MTKARPITQLLQTGSVSELLAHARRLHALSALLHRCLTPELAPHARLLRWEEGQLTVQTDSAAWATRLRYLAPQLLRCLQQLPPFAEARRIEIHIAPVGTPAATKKPQPAHLSPDSAYLIEVYAATVTDPHLRAALQRLARRGKPR